ncbi:MAG: SDR family NAD(P)-dependent oxidoreductase, partial [Pseudomonadota bacterium]
MTGSILLTGGTGFIGSHVAVSLLEAGQDVIIFDNLSNSDRSVVERVATIAGRAPIFVEGDLRDKSALTSVFENHQTSAVMHFAGLKSVSKSQSQSADYWDVNVGGSVNLVQAAKNA